jgi:hypothetical protein
MLLFFCCAHAMRKRGMHSAGHAHIELSSTTFVNDYNKVKGEKKHRDSSKTSSARHTHTHTQTHTHIHHSNTKRDYSLSLFLSPLRLSRKIYHSHGRDTLRRVSK